MLTDLKQAHEALLGYISELEAVTQAPVPDAGELARVRWKLSQASARRRRIVDEAITRLMVDAVADETRRLNQLRENTAEMVAATSRHVGAWSIEDVLADWDGYRRASEAMRRSMRERISLEKSLLYPLLGRAA